VTAPTGRARVLAGIDSRDAERFAPERLVDRLLGDDGEWSLVASRPAVRRERRTSL
jgi:hypothetical protein